MRQMKKQRLIPLISIGFACLTFVPITACRYDSGQVAVPGIEGATKTAAKLRAERRLYDGAPPVIAHGPMGADCTGCHTLEGMAVEGLGFAPPAPHEKTLGLSAMSRCEQCHVFRKTDEVFVESEFTGLEQNLRHGRKLNQLAPPVMPHKSFMRENCIACHSGPAAREEIRTPHPERARCRQCHVEQKATDEFVSVAKASG